jgi:hypothetical protein
LVVVDGLFACYAVCTCALSQCYMWTGLYLIVITCRGHFYIVLVSRGSLLYRSVMSCTECFCKIKQNHIHTRLVFYTSCYHFVFLLYLSLNYITFRHLHTTVQIIMSEHNRQLWYSRTSVHVLLWTIPNTQVKCSVYGGVRPWGL